MWGFGCGWWGFPGLGSVSLDDPSRLWPVGVPYLLPGCFLGLGFWLVLGLFLLVLWVLPEFLACGVGLSPPGPFGLGLWRLVGLLDALGIWCLPL